MSSSCSYQMILLKTYSQLHLSPSHHHNYKCNLLHFSLWIRASAKWNQMWFFSSEPVSEFLIMLMYLHCKQTFAPRRGAGYPHWLPKTSLVKVGQWSSGQLCPMLALFIWGLHEHWFIHHCNLIRVWMLMAQTSFQSTVLPPPLRMCLSFSDLSRALCMCGQMTDVP